MLKKLAKKAKKKGAATSKAHVVDGQAGRSSSAPRKAAKKAGRRPPRRGVRGPKARSCTSIPPPDAFRQAEAFDYLQAFIEWDSNSDSVGAWYTDREARWKAEKFHRAICDALNFVDKGEIRRLMVFMPPRHGKSEIISRKFPPWFLIRHPEEEIIMTSYGADLAEGFSGDARDTFKYRAPILSGPDGMPLALDPRSSQRANWKVSGHRGECFAAGVGGGTTGRGAKVLIIDDPVKNSEEALSATSREKTWLWYKTVARTRLAPGGAVVLIMTRWHEDDLGGRLLQGRIKTEKTVPVWGGGTVRYDVYSLPPGVHVDSEEDKLPWHVLKFPAFAEENDPLGRQPGEVLWPASYPESELMQLKVDLDMGDIFFESLFQQNPHLEEGNMFKRENFRKYRIEGDFYVLVTPTGEKRVEKAKCYVFQTCDPAGTEKDKSHFFVLSTWARTPDSELILLDVYREKAETTKHEDIVSYQYFLHNPSFIGVEEKIFGINIIQELKKKGYPILALAAKGDKISRAWVAVPRYREGMVFHPMSALWLEECETELLLFPNGKYDDFVDTVSNACIHVVPPAKDQRKRKKMPRSSFRPKSRVYAGYSR